MALQWGTFFKVVPITLPSASRVPFWTDFGTFFEGFSVFSLPCSLPKLFLGLCKRQAIGNIICDSTPPLKPHGKQTLQIPRGPAVSRRMASSIKRTLLRKHCLGENRIPESWPYVHQNGVKWFISVWVPNWEQHKDPIGPKGPIGDIFEKGTF